MATVLSRAFGVGMGVFVEPCVFETITSSLTQPAGDVDKVSLNASTVNLSSMFNCKNWPFEVNRTAFVEVNDAIVVGRNTEVRITGQGLLTTVEESTASAFIDITNGTGHKGQLLRLTRQLVLPLGLEAADVGVVPECSIADTNTTTVLGPIFDVQEGGTLSLERMVVRGGLVAGNTFHDRPGISLMESNVSITNCEFSDTFTLDNSGGIYVEKSVLKVADSRFTHCWAGFHSQDDDDDPDGKGGAIHVRRNATIGGLCCCFGPFFFLVQFL